MRHHKYQFFLLFFLSFLSVVLLTSLVFFFPLREWVRIEILVVVVLLFSAWQAYRFSAPLSAMTSQLNRYAAGDYSNVLPAVWDSHFDQLFNPIKQMVQDLESRLYKIHQQDEEKSAILTSMVESVMTVDLDARIQSLNRSAEVLLSVKAQDCQGRHIQEVIRNTSLRDFVGNVITSLKPIEKEIKFEGPKTRYFYAQGCALKNPKQKVFGALIVLYDVTRIKQLEAIQKQFVSNVSHELKTPLTSLHGYIETLEDEFDSLTPVQEKIFKTLNQNVVRLELLIDDILLLSRLELEDTDIKKVATQSVCLADVIEATKEACFSKLKEKQIQIHYDDFANEFVPFNYSFLIQALTNLVSNAIKYTDVLGEVHIVKDTSFAEWLKVSVVDSGPGIEAKHLPHLFDRFYRADASRNRAEGGTGLGLAIVMQIMTLFHGKVTVDSVVGKGSTFTLWLRRDAVK